MINIIREFISDWIKSLVILMIIISIVDMAMPNGNMKRYVNFIVGLIIVFSIINPFVNWTNSNLILEKEVNSFRDKTYNESLFVVQDKQIESIYLSSLESEVENIIETNTDYSTEFVDITTIIDDEGNFQIDEIYVDIKNKNPSSSTDIKIDKIRVGQGKDYKSNLSEEPEVKELVANHLQLDKNKVCISIGDKGD